MRVAFIFMAVVMALLFSGCPSQTSRGRTSTAFKKTTREVSRGILRASTIAAAAETYVTIVRYNPAKCACPPFEIMAYGRWTRVLFSGDPSALDRLAAFQTSEKQNPSLGAVDVQGRFLGDLEAAANEVTYPLFDLVFDLESDAESDVGNR